MLQADSDLCVAMLNATFTNIFELHVPKHAMLQI